MNRLLYIPTNHDCQVAIKQYYEESISLSVYAACTVYFVVIESGNKESEILNSRTIKKLVPNDNVKVIHFTLKKQTNLINSILNNLTISKTKKEKLLSLLIPNGISYSAGPNKAAILAASLGLDVIHRRDSDTLPSVFNSQFIYPSIIECKCIGENTNSIINIINEPEPDLFNNSKVYFVGSDYIGDSPVDFEEITSISKELLFDQKKIDHPDATDNKIWRRIEEYYINRNITTYNKDEIFYDIKGLTEMGVSSTYLIFKDLPEMPIKDTLGCDYMQKNLLYRLNYPVIYHNRKVLHIHPNDRKEKKISDFIEYNLRNTRFKILIRIRNKHNLNLEKNRAKLIGSNGSIINSSFYAESFADIATKADLKELSQLVDSFSEIFTKAYNLTNNKEVKFLSLSDEMQKQKRKLIDEVINGILDYCELIQVWNSIMNSSKNINIMKILRIKL